MPVTVPTGVRLNNPGNLRKSAIAYKGLSAEQPDANFSTFDTAIYGIRAIAMCLQAYQHQHGCRTISDIVNRYAPNSENPTENYIKFIEDNTGIQRDRDIDVEDYDTAFKLIKAIIHFEQGYNPYSDAQIGKALVLSGLEPKNTVNKSRTVRGQQIITASVSTNALIEGAKENLSTASDTMQSLAPHFQWAQYALFFITFIGVGLTLYAYYDDNRRGLHP